jgi:LacI family gluconate utilization system Gnt-I transcriptional repressor
MSPYLLSLPKQRTAQKGVPSRRPANNLGASRATGHVTLHDVARLAGVSCMTVSRVLNRPEVVTPDTIAAVRKAVAHTGYIPNLLAGALVSRRSRLVAAIIPTVANSAFTDTIQSLIDRLGEAGYQVFLGLSGFQALREQDLVTAILSRRPDAIFLAGVTHSAETRNILLRAKIPVVEEPADLTHTPIDMLVGFSHEKVGQAVANYLLRKKYRRLGLVWTLKEGYAAKREYGFLSTLEKHGITDVPTSRILPPSTLRLGREGLAQLLDAGHRLDVVFCATDALAQGVLTEAHARGLSVPKDLAVMGFGDQDFAACTFPALSTVHVDRTAIGRLAADAILARLEGRTRTRKVIDVGFEITERAST